MKLKEIERTANVAWSPAQQYPVYLACGTAAQQLDASFNTKSSLELFRFNPEENSLECELISATETDQRFNKVIWGSLGINNGTHASGVIVGATEGGSILVWDAAKLVMEETDSLVLSLQKHAGSIKALDFNKFQENLLASGGSDSEIYLWDLNNPTTPMTPGVKSQPSDDVTCLSWNCQVQHILASTFNTRCVVWDLRKNEPIVKISDSMSRIRSKLVTWHPEVATQLVLASEDDHTPVVQLWDLRFAASPIKVLDKHQKGILSMAWNRRDPDLFMTCGKDNRLICWNANADIAGGEVVYELPIGNQWCFDVQWCPRNPQCISACSFDGRVSVYTVMGGRVTTMPIAATNKIADSFGGFDNLSAPQTLPKSETVIIPQISKAPKWLRRPTGASFSFGGKLVTFSNPKPKDSNQPQQRQITIHQVITEKDLISQSNQLEHAIHNRQYQEYCAMKMANSNEEFEQSIWQFLKINFESEHRAKYISALGFKDNELKQKISSTVVNDGDHEDDLSLKMTSAAHINDQTSPADAFEHQIAKSDFGAAEISLNSSQGIEGLLTQALITGNLEQAIELCFHENRMTDAVILANASGPTLLQKTVKRYLSQCKSSTARLISAVVYKDYNSLVESANLDSWKEILATVLTYAKAEECSKLCDRLGERLLLSPQRDQAANAILCYICSGNIDRFVECWLSQRPDASTSRALQELVEKVMVLRKAFELQHGQDYTIRAKSELANKLGQYAELLAAEGSLKTALTYVSCASQSQKLAVLKYRLQSALGQATTESPWPRPKSAAAQQKQPLSHHSQASASTHAAAPQQPLQNMVNPYQQQSQASHVSKVAYPQQTDTSYVAQKATAGSYAYSGSHPVTALVYNSTPQQTPVYNSTPQQTPYTQNSYGGAQSSYAQPTNVGPTYQQQSYQAPSYGSAGGYYNHPSQPAGHIASRGVLGKKYGASSDANASVAAAPAAPAPATYFTPTSVSPSAAPMMQPNFTPSNPAPATYPVVGMAYTQQYSSPAVPVASVEDARKGPTGWNDPPPVYTKKEPEIVNKSAVKAAPITHPVYNPNPMADMHASQQVYGNQPMYMPNVQPGQPYATQMQGVPAGSVAPVQNYSSPHSPQASPPMPEPPKAALPEKHRVLKETFDILASKCLHASNNPQQKKKLEDVIKKLEFLYDKLRAGSLSDSLSTGLHQIVSAIKQYDYHTGLAVHTALVTQGNFSEISAFMPGLKMLMQTAQQLQVYV